MTRAQHKYASGLFGYSSWSIAPLHLLFKVAYGDYIEAYPHKRMKSQCGVLEVDMQYYGRFRRMKTFEKCLTMRGVSHWLCQFWRWFWEWGEKQFRPTRSLKSAEVAQIGASLLHGADGLQQAEAVVADG
jgi:hypothetical protein